MKTYLLFILVFSVFNFSRSEGRFDSQKDERGTVIKRSAQNTVVPVLLNKGDVLEFRLRNGQIRTLQLLETDASIMRTNVKDFHKEDDLQSNGGTICEFSCKVLIDGHEMKMQRYLPTQESFYEPYVVNGMRIWFDAVKDYFNFFSLKHDWCEPRADARFAISDATDPVAPDLECWFPIKQPYNDVSNSYLGDDVWMGPYLGVEPHGGMDINMPKGTPLFTPFDILEKDNQWLDVGFEPKPYYWAATWMAQKYWPNGSEWTLKLLHLDKYLVEDHAPLQKGTQIAEAAGTGVGAEEHTHFDFMVRDEPTNTVDNKVMLLGNIISKEGSEYKINVEDVVGNVPLSAALYIRRDDRPADFSIFMVSKNIADKYNFNYEIPQIKLDPWYLLWQMFENYKLNNNWIKAHISPMAPAKAGNKVLFSSKDARPGLNRSELSYYWTFGDGCWSDEKNPTHIFTSPGIFPVSLLVDDGERKDRYTQHITIDGKKIDMPGLSLNAPLDPTFNKRKDYVMDVYGSTITNVPHNLTLSARETNLSPEARVVNITNNGGGVLDTVQVNIQYKGENNWASITSLNNGNDQRLTVKVNADGLPPGKHKAVVNVSCGNAVNSPQRFILTLDVCLNTGGDKLVIVDNESQSFFATPYFWVGCRFKEWIDGYNNFYLTNGGRNNPGEYVRFTPDLKKGKYNISLVEETPFNECKMKIQVHHANGDTILWIEPLKSRNIGVFKFDEGRDGFVQIFAEGSEGEILADAIKFMRIEN